MKRVAQVLVGALVAVGAVACGSGSSGGGQPGATSGHAAPAPTSVAAGAVADDAEVAATVRVAGFAYSPATVTIKAGQTVEWVFADGPIPHDVVGTSTNAPDGFASEQMSEGTFAFTFTAPGTYDYFCSIHPQMVGKVVVE